MTASGTDQIASVDTMTLIWGVRKKADRPEDQEKIKRADWLLTDLEENNVQVLVASIALAEYLVPYPPATHADVIAPLARRFFIAPFDVKCAALAARLFAEGKQQRQMNRQNARNLLKADSSIIATAAVHGARIFYSDDGDCRKLAERANLIARPLPVIAPDLFSQ